ncbi:molecular chaperone [Pseudomonas sp. TE6283]
MRTLSVTIHSYLLVLLGLLLSSPLLAAPALNVGGLYDYLDADRSTLLKRVRNSGDSTAFVKVSVAELVYESDGTVREVDQQTLPVEERGLVASPARLIIPARGMQAIRLLYRGERDRERYFRLRFIPVLPEHNDGFALSEAQAQGYKESLQAGVNVLAGYGTLLFVTPSRVSYQTPVEQKGGSMVISNAGNATVVLDHFRQCDRKGDKCDTAIKHHLLPGRTREFSVADGRFYQFELHEGRDRRDVVVGR